MQSLQGVFVIMVSPFTYDVEVDYARMVWAKWGGVAAPNDCHQSTHSPKNRSCKFPNNPAQARIRHLSSFLSHHP